jgi:TPR repeat protein
MKLLASTTLLFLLVIGFSGGVSGQSFEETKRLAEQGDVYAQTVLGLMYADGEGVPENDAEAVKGYRLAAEQGDASAQSNLRGMSAYGMVNESNRKLTKNF